MDLYKELITIVSALKGYGIEYALCGGMAMAFHGYPRFTADIDIIIKKADLQHLKKVLKEINYSIVAGPFPFDVKSKHPREMHRISRVDGEDTITLDILLVNQPLEDVWESREVFTIEGVEISVVSHDGLVKMKKIAGREQDLVDIKKLEMDNENS